MPRDFNQAYVGCRSRRVWHEPVGLTHRTSDARRSAIFYILVRNPNEHCRFDLLQTVIAAALFAATPRMLSSRAAR